MILPSAIIFCNNDLTDNVKNKIIKQLFITDVLDGYVFDGYQAADPTFADTVKKQDRRMLVIRSFQETANRELADVVIFVKAGLAAILKNNWGPPGVTYPVINLYWGKLCIFEKPSILY